MRRVLLRVSVAAALAVAASPATSQPGVATLSGEILLSCGPALFCSDEAGTRTFRTRCTEAGGRISWTVTGVASGPYPGTFTETGTAEFAATDDNSGGPLTRLEVSFHIDSPLGQVEGTKFLSPASLSVASCETPGVGEPHVIGTAQARYEAIIRPVTGGSFADEGVTRIDFFAISPEDPFAGEVETSSGFIFEDFTSELGFARPLLPDAKEQCKNNGFLIFGFKNQGDCVSFVETHGKNEPGKNQKG